MAVRGARSRERNNEQFARSRFINGSSRRGPRPGAAVALEGERGGDAGGRGERRGGGKGEEGEKGEEGK